MSLSHFNSEQERIAYQERVFARLVKMKSGEEFLMESVPPENRQKFIDTVKHIMDAGYPYHFKCSFAFNSDYSKIRKDTL